MPALQSANVSAWLGIPAGYKPSWPNLIPIVAAHGLAVLALRPQWLTTEGIWTCLFFTHFVTVAGINLCYHRALTHRSLRLPLWLEHFFVLCAVCCVQGPPAQWVATHRAHHRYADGDQDPHSPRSGFFWAHVGWLLFQPSNPAPIALYARDILKDPFYRWLQASLGWVWILLAHIALVFCGGVGLGIAEGKPWADSLQLGLSVMIWGVFVRTIIVWHVTWSVNSFSHMLGYRNYDVRDTSRNNVIVALLGSGEGWHNNHHADSASASNWHRWWEFDFTWLFIRALRGVGLAYDVIPPRAQRLARTEPSITVPTQRAETADNDRAQLR